MLGILEGLEELAEQRAINNLNRDPHHVVSVQEYLQRYIDYVTRFTLTTIWGNPPFTIG